jgi:hypothetical protein
MSRNQCLLRYGRVNVWVGIFGDQLLGPGALPSRLTSAVYHRFFVNDLPVLLEHQRQHMSMHNGAPPHSLRIVRQHLNQWTGRGGPSNWPARSSGLNPLDVWL